MTSLALYANLTDFNQNSGRHFLTEIGFFKLKVNRFLGKGAYEVPALKLE